MNPAASLTARPFTEQDDLEAELDLAHRAFGDPGPANRPRRLAVARDCVAKGQLVGVFDGVRLLASARYYDMRQWWQGRSLPLSGVAGVKVAPEERGRGIGRRLMTEMLVLIAERGYPLAALHPVTAPLYRKLGFEIAGGMYQVTCPARALRTLLAADLGQPETHTRDRLRRASSAAADEVIALLGRLHGAARDCGPVTFDRERTARWLEDPQTYAYLAEDGFLGYHWHGGTDEVRVRRLAAGSSATARALWSVVASHGSIARTVRANVGPADPVTWLSTEPDVALTRREVWMLRVVGAADAIAGRGFPPTAELAVTVTLHDDLFAANSGHWALTVGGGHGSLTPARTTGAIQSASRQPVSFGARGFAALFAGTPMTTLRLAGLADGGDPADDPRIDEAFAATAYLHDYF